MVAAVLSAALALAPVEIRAKDAEQDAEKVELFDAIDQGLVEVKLKQNGALEGNLTVKNLSGQPLEIDVPSAFAAVPVAQWGVGGGMPGGMPGPMPGMGGGLPGVGGGMGPGMGAQNRGLGLGGPGNQPGRMGLNSGRNGGGRNGGGGGNQSVGGSRGGMGGGRGGRGGGWFVAPEKTVREKIRTVCLEHGKNDPYGGQEYALVPIETISENKTTRALVEMLGDDNVDQQALQAAVWNQENEVSMDELAQKVYQPAGNVTPRPWFSAEQLEASSELIKAAETRAEEIAAEEAAQEKAEELKAEEEALSSDSEKEVDTTIEKLTEELQK
ncbi:MAG: hypothetical protein IK105_03020 [Thermoguttaceae bacterium]|nr:hypothetical protein [Thermoguttaceae bacterium]